MSTTINTATTVNLHSCLSSASVLTSATMVYTESDVTRNNPISCVCVSYEADISDDLLRRTVMHARSLQSTVTGWQYYCNKAKYKTCTWGRYGCTCFSADYV